MASRLNDQDLELLSAYLDAALAPSDRAALEARLTADAALRAELDALRRTRQILRAAPVLTPPRNFTLDPARYRRRPSRTPGYVVFQWAGMLGAAAAVMLIVFGTLFSTTFSSAPAPASAFLKSEATKTIVVALLPTQTRTALPSPLPSATVIPRTATSPGDQQAAPQGFAQETQPAQPTTQKSSPAASGGAGVTPAPLVATTPTEEAVGQSAPAVQPPQVEPNPGGSGGQTGSDSGATAQDANAGNNPATTSQTNPQNNGAAVSGADKPSPATASSGVEVSLPATPSPAGTQPALEKGAAQQTYPPATQALPPPTAVVYAATATAVVTDATKDNKGNLAQPTQVVVSITNTPAATATSVAVDDLDSRRAAQPGSATDSSRLLLISGITLLVISLVMLAIGLFRRRLL